MFCIKFYELSKNDFEQIKSFNKQAFRLNMSHYASLRRQAHEAHSSPVRFVKLAILSVKFSDTLYLDLPTKHVILAFFSVKLPDTFHVILSVKLPDTLYCTKKRKSLNGSSFFNGGRGETRTLMR